jgi:hypothetical protein
LKACTWLLLLRIARRLMLKKQMQECRCIAVAVVALHGRCYTRCPRVCGAIRGFCTDQRCSKQFFTVLSQMLLASRVCEIWWSSAHEMLCCDHTRVGPGLAWAISSRGTVVKIAGLESSFTTVTCEHAEAIKQRSLQNAFSDATRV